MGGKGHGGGGGDSPLEGGRAGGRGGRGGRGGGVLGPLPTELKRPETRARNLDSLDRRCDGRKRGKEGGIGRE